MWSYLVVEVVYIGTLHTQHLRLGLMMLEAGKHVLCEKPVGMNGKELRQLLDKAKEKGVFFMEVCGWNILMARDAFIQYSNPRF